MFHEIKNSLYKTRHTSYPPAPCTIDDANQSCQPPSIACLGLSARQVRRPIQAEILSFGLACFGPESAVPDQQARPGRAS